MACSEQIVLAKKPTSAFAILAFWILVPTGIAWGCVLLRGGSLHGVWVGPALSSLFLGSFLSHLRARKGLCVTKAGLLWRVPSRMEFLGGITTTRIEWNYIESCQAIRVGAKMVSGCSFDGLEIRVSREATPSPAPQMDTMDRQDTTARTIVVADESWAWTKQGRAFLDACRTQDGLLNWRS